MFCLPLGRLNAGSLTARISPQGQADAGFQGSAQTLLWGGKVQSEMWEELELNQVSLGLQQAEGGLIPLDIQAGTAGS